MNTHITRTVPCCFAVLRQIRSISQPVVQSLIVSLVISRLEYGNATLAVLPVCQLNILQYVSNPAVRLIYRFRKFDHMTPLLHDLHWLRIPKRITFRLVVLAYRCQNGLAPQYTLLMTFTRWRRSSHGATAAFGGDCGTDRPSRGAFYDRRSRFLYRCRSGVEQPSALGYTSSASLPVFRKHLFLRQFCLLAFPAIETLFYAYIVTLFYPAVVRTCFSIMRFSL